MKLTATITALAVLAMFLVSPPTVSADDGAALFKQKCAVCHGQDGSGDTAMGKKKGIKALGSEDVQKKSDADLTSQIADGGAKKEAAHAFKKKGLTDDQIKSLVSFVRSLKK